MWSVWFMGFGCGDVVCSKKVAGWVGDTSRLVDPVRGEEWITLSAILLPGQLVEDRVVVPLFHVVRVVLDLAVPSESLGWDGVGVVDSVFGHGLLVRFVCSAAAAPHHTVGEGRYIP